MHSILRKTAAGIALAAGLSAPTLAQQKVEITLARFFGSCEADYGKSTDFKAARGECGIITTLVNNFNATNKENIVVKPQIVEWGPYYDQLTARIVARDVPTVAVMHDSSLGDYVGRKLVDPLDDGFQSVGIHTSDFTEHAKKGTVIGGKTYALPFDTWSWLWHINLNLMHKAGLTRTNGSPVLPTSPEELLAQARQFRQATGKPYFAWAATNSDAANVRSFLSLLYQQDADLFSAGSKPRLNVKSKEATQVLELMRKLYSEGLVAPNLDYGAANQTFVNGQAGVVVVGTWKIDDFIVQSEKVESPLYKGYTVVPFAQLYAKKAVFAGGHTWVMLRGGAKDEAQRKAALHFMKFLWENNGEWARTGHLPANRTVIEGAAFKSLPMRSNITEIATTGRGMPGSIPRQRAIETILGQEIGNMLLSKKPVAQVQEAAETRVNKLLDSVH
ncbi:extracellular solute-binding protein [Verminephrobacter aporrectodeae subsp. tuberculatae]|uniref:extracellular solute-binding protein n=1 Tax=Verminephrobacter aporrectodeae TaxID=1110389 RepID=UPI0022446F04|nr:extracellular solute-binding protein [Verminephrobacter aporrectodeae]MCW8208788.1 extracellular solute-binding protein [Verminephrobacter aporrectodeae subsp. tuberculatae]